MQRNNSDFCDSCGGMFDPHNSPCQWVETKHQQFLICGTCYHGHTDDELSERLEQVQSQLGLLT